MEFPLTLAVGICTFTQLGTEIVSTLSETYREANKVLFNPITSPSPSQQELESAYFDYCTPDCHGAIADYEDENCEDDYVSMLTTNLCLKSIGELGNRCFFAMMTK